MTKKSWLLTPEEDPATGELIITFPPEALEEMGWKEGDVINWDQKEDGSIILSKKETE
jgi:bifunctional DNA-binding transcriptional regulator/antitoxin component of YhaV-PrlF toxin-antitoxin module